LLNVNYELIKELNIYMPLQNFLTKSIFKASERKLLLIELKLETRSLRSKVKKLGISSNIKKMYLLFIVFTLMIPLFTLNPSANLESKLLKIVEADQTDKPTNIVFAEPASVTIDTSNVNSNNDFTKYTIKDNEKLETIIDRVGNLDINTLKVNNPGKEFKSGTEIIIPREKGYLLAYNKQSDPKEISSGLLKNEGDIKKIIDNNKEGYIFIKGEDPLETKKMYDKNVARFRYNLSDNVSINFVTTQTGSSSSAVPNEDFSNALNAFIAQFQGRRHHDGNGWSMGECVSLVKRWQQFIGASYGIWPGYNGYPRNAWAGYRAGNRGLAPDNSTFGVMIEGNVNNLKPGDIIVIDTPTSHTGIATGRYNGGMYEVFDQNSPVGSGARFTSYSKSSFIAALRYYRK
jgi:hypothetical protein